ncbi:MAG: glycosyltransferase family 1 protein [Actinobacteria bacterium]|nr:glycosyltransferase family 1 protein [Actinomycetota bacterium]
MNSKNRKILLVTNDLGPRVGGIESFILGLLARIEQNSVVILTSSQKNCQPFDQELLSKYGAIVIRDRSKILLPTPRVIHRAKKIMVDFNSTTIWFGAAAPLAIMAGSLRKSGAKNIVALTHGHEVWWAKLPIFRSAISKITKDVDILTYLVDFTKNAMLPAIIDKSKLVKIAPGIDVDHFSPAESDQNLIEKYRLNGRRVIVSVGRLVHRKGQDKLIEAMPEVLKRFPNAVLLLVGQGPIQSMLEKLIRHYNLENNVIFTGRIQFADLPRYIQLGEIFAMPCRDRFFGLEVEGLGIVYLEASACGIPVIVGKSGGAPDAVINNKTGLIVDGRYSSEIAEAVCKLLSDEELARKMGNEGRKWIVDNWRWEIWSNKFNKLLSY